MFIKRLGSVKLKNKLSSAHQDSISISYILKYHYTDCKKIYCWT